MRILVTAGNTLTPIDRVRCITNVFTGRTGAGIALHAHERGHAVTLLTSHPEAVTDLQPQPPATSDRWNLRTYRTFDDLHQALEPLVRQGHFDVVVHCAAVSDYRAAGIFAPAPGTEFRDRDGIWTSLSASPPALIDRAAGKVKSDEPELWLRLVRTPKLIDFMRGDWGFRGTLVKFKLEVGLSEEALSEVAERSRCQSAADLMVANTLEGAGTWAFLGPIDGQYRKIGRRELAPRLLEAIERLRKELSHG